MTVITLSREFGSEGTRIATEAAKALGYHVADKDVMEKVLRRYGLINFEEVDGGLPNFWIYFDEQLRLTADMLDQTIKALAQHGNIVIIGRGSHAVLHGLGDVLNVRIQAPQAMRVQRVMELYQLNLADATARVAEADRARVSFIERAYKVSGEDARTFDLVFNLGTIEPAFATRLIVEAARTLHNRSRTAAPTTADFKISGTLTHVINDVLNCETRHA